MKQPMDSAISSLLVVRLLSSEGMGVLSSSGTGR